MGSSTINIHVARTSYALGCGKYVELTITPLRNFATHQGLNYAAGSSAALATLLFHVVAIKPISYQPIDMPGG